jgi:hypothetical protein
LFGKITSTFWNGADISEVIYYPKTRPNDCYTKIGVNHLNSSLVHITIRNNGKGEVDCSGFSTMHFHPGLTS